MSELRDQLTDIQGVGDATADKILEIVENQSAADVSEHVEKAYDYHQDGQHEYAAKYVQRAYEALD